MHNAEKLAVELIIEVIKRQYGYDFSDYSRASLKRRLIHHKTKLGLASLADMIPLLINNPHSFDELLTSLSVTVTELFRDPEFYQAFADEVVPKLKTYPYLKVWHAGCSTGEEVYSMAILLHENKYLDRTQLYATDFNPYALNIARKGIYPNEHINAYVDNYRKSGGGFELEDYFVEKYEAIKVKRFLQERIAFSQHNLATDHIFGDMEVIVCRNVMIYFDERLKRKVLDLFNESLVVYGFLCLGDKETLDYPGFRVVNEAASIYQKVPK